MNEQKMNDLLQRYFDGATTLDEERILKRYFAGSDIYESHRAYQPMFAFFAQEREVELTGLKPDFGEDCAVEEFKVSRIHIFKSWNLGIISAIAASIALLLWIGLAQTKTDDFIYFVNGQRIYDQTAAIALAEDKLQMLAESMQIARNSMAALEKLQESNQSLMQLNKISEAYRQIEEVGAKMEELRIRN